MTPLEIKLIIGKAEHRLGQANWGQLTEALVPVENPEFLHFIPNRRQPMPADPPSHYLVRFCRKGPGAPWYFDEIVKS